MVSSRREEVLGFETSRRSAFRMADLRSDEVLRPMSDVSAASWIAQSFCYGRAGAVANGLARIASAISANAARRTNARRRFRRVTPAGVGAAIPVSYTHLTLPTN